MSASLYFNKEEKGKKEKHPIKIPWAKDAFPGRTQTHTRVHPQPPSFSITELLLVWALSPIQTLHRGPDQHCVLSGAPKKHLLYDLCRMD